MKKLLFILSFFIFLSGAYSQKMYGFDRQLSLLSYNADESKVVGFGYTARIDGGSGMEFQIIVWDKTGVELYSRRLAGLNKITIDGNEYRGSTRMAKINPDRTLIYILGVQYQTKGQQIKSVFHIYDIEKNQLETVIADRENEIDKFSFHPKIPGLLAVTYSNQPTGSKVGIWDLSKGIWSLKTYTAKSNYPLSLEFSKDGKHLLVGCSTSPYHGNIEIFDMNTMKLLKQIPNDKDQILHFGEWNGKYYCTGSNGTYIINSKTLAYERKLPVAVGKIDAERNIALLNPIKVVEENDVRLYNLKTEKTSVLIPNLCLSQPVFSGDATKILGINCKNEFVEGEITLKTPSAMIVPFEK